MMENDCLNFDIDSQIDAQQKIEWFVTYVKSPISEDLFEAALNNVRVVRQKK